MFRKLSFLITVLALSTTMTLNAAEKDESELGSTSQPSKKIRLEEKAKPEVSIDLCPLFRKDVIVELNLSNNQHLTDINFLLGFPSLTRLNLRNCWNLKDNYYPISRLTNLRTLDMSGIGLTTTTEYLRPLINLTSLKIFIVKNDMKNIVQLPSLKDLTLYGAFSRGSFGELDQLSELKSLEKLSLSGMFNNDEDDPDFQVPSLDFLSKLAGLKILDLSSSDYVYYIKPIVNLPKLTDLDLSGCKSIRDLREISKLKSLVKLNLDFLDELYMPTIKKDLYSLKELKNLRILTIHPSLSVDDLKLPKEIIIHKSL